MEHPSFIWASLRVTARGADDGYTSLTWLPPFRQDGLLDTHRLVQNGTFVQTKLTKRPHFIQVYTAFAVHA